MREASNAFLGVLEEFGIVVEEGKPDGGGNPFTAERVEEIRQRIDESCWSILRDNYIIEGD